MIRNGTRGCEEAVMKRAAAGERDYSRRDEQTN